MGNSVTSQKALKLVNYLINKGINGIEPILTSASDLANEYLMDKSYKNHDERVESLIRWEMSKSFTQGFITSLGGLITMPVTVPASLGASWLIAARLAGTIAHIHGHSLEEDRVRTMILLTILGDSTKDVLKEVGIKVTNKITHSLIMQIPGKVLIEINKKVGFRLLTKAGEKGIINLAKIVPLAGGVVGGTVDALYCRKVGKIAHETFKRS